MMRLFALLPRWLTVFACIGFAPALHAVIIEMPSVRVETPAGRDASSLSTYEPFNVIATFSKPYCFSETYPLYVSANLKSNVLSLVLSHLKSGPCVQRRTLPVSGLRPGAYTVRVSVTDDDLKNTHEVEAGSTTVTIGVGSVVNVTLGFVAARIDGGDIKPFGAYSPSDAPVTLTTLNTNFDVLNERAHWLDLTGGTNLGVPSFFAYGLTSFAPALPSAMAELFVIKYPSPFRGLFITTSESVARSLQREWHPESPQLRRSALAVLNSQNGTCPFGAAPVYQLFHPIVVAHRWTMDLETYSMLAQNGYVPEGVSFCAPKLG
jgi:hypothetical protein